MPVRGYCPKVEPGDEGMSVSRAPKSFLFWPGDILGDADNLSHLEAVLS